MEKFVYLGIGAGIAWIVFSSMRKADVSAAPEPRDAVQSGNYKAPVDTSYLYASGGYGQLIPAAGFPFSPPDLPGIDQNFAGHDITVETRP